MIHEQKWQWGKKKKDQNKTKPCGQVSGCQFLKTEFYSVIKKMRVFPNFLNG